MLEKNLEIIYNKPYLVIASSSKSQTIIDALSYTLGNLIIVDDNTKEQNKVIEFIKNNNFPKIIFVDYQPTYDRIIYQIKETHKLEFIYTGTLGNLSNMTEYNFFKKILNLSNLHSNSKFALLDECLYKVLKKKYPKVINIILDIESHSSENNYDEKTIGVLNDQLKPTHSYYNELSSIGLNNEFVAKVSNINKVTKRFLSKFNIKYNITSKEDLYKNNLVNLYVNFTDNNDLEIIKSMDNNTPCIIGNTNIFKGYKILEEYLVVKSDDDVNEIYEKIEKIKNNRTKIMDEYKLFRKNYSKQSKESLEKFIKVSKKESSKKEYEKLLTVVFPVYNVEKYIRKSLQSVIDARIDDMEILVVNDGSPDNCHEIILEFAKKYPDLIRYIKQENHGLGNVRNVGLKEAKGKYIVGVDSDDTINKKTFKSALKYLKQDIDIVMYDWLTVTDTFKCQTPSIDPCHYDKNKYKGLLYTSIMPTSSNKIMKKEFFDELKVKYVEDKYEDLSANPLMLLKAETIKYIDKPFYEYYIRSNSIMRSKPGYSMIHVIKELNKLIEKHKDIINVNLEEFKFHTFTWRIEEFIIDPLYTIEEKDMVESIKLINKDIKDIYTEIIKSTYYKNLLKNFPNKDKVKYIEKRNKALIEGNLKTFIEEVRKNNKYQNFKTYEVVYGKEEKND